MKEDVIRSVREKKVVAIIRGFSPEICLRLSETYAKGGIGLVEVTFDQKAPGTWKDTAAAVRAIGERFAGTLRVGAGVGGTLTNKEWIAAGAWDRIEAEARALVARAGADGAAEGENARIHGEGRMK